MKYDAKSDLKRDFKRKRGKRFCLCVLTAVALFISASFYGRGVGVNAGKQAVQCSAAKNAVHSRAECVMELSSRRVLYEYNANERLPMASTTKIATALTVIESETDLNEEFSVPKEATGIEGSSVYLKEGERVTARELLYGLMLRSGNDCAVALALKTSGSVENFAELMNKTARRAGAFCTQFKNPHGLPARGHYTTAKDLSKITCRALERTEFASIVSTRHYEPRGWTNKNKMLTLYDGAIGVKTGYTKEAGRCLVSAAKRGNITLICCVLSCADTYARSKTLLDDAFSCHENVLLHGAHTPVELSGASGKTVAKTGKDLYYPLRKEEQNYIKNVVIAFDKPLTDEKGREIFGQLRFYLLKNLIFSENLYKL